MTPPPTVPSAAIPTKPSLKIKITPPTSIRLPPSDLTALVAAAIRARPSPRRNQPDFYFCDTLAQPVAPPPTPADEGFLTPSSTGMSTPGSAKKVRFSFDSIEDEGEDEGEEVVGLAAEIGQSEAKVTS